MSALFITGMILSGCGNQTTRNTNANKNDNLILTVYTTIYPLENFTQKIGGDFVGTKAF
jgi:zinc transport system substrate-binding protein